HARAIIVGRLVVHGRSCLRVFRQYLIQTVLGSVKKRSAASPPSRPTPLFLVPPNGVRRSRSSQQFTHTVPHSSCSATRCARARWMYDVTLSKWAREINAPWSTVGSSGSPTFSRRVASTKRSTNEGYRLASTKMREPHRQISPWFSKEERTLVLSTSSRSASA